MSLFFQLSCARWNPSSFHKLLKQCIYWTGNASCMSRLISLRKSCKWSYLCTVWDSREWNWGVQILRSRFCLHCFADWIPQLPAQSWGCAHSQRQQSPVWVLLPYIPSSFVASTCPRIGVGGCRGIFAYRVHIDHWFLDLPRVLAYKVLIYSIWHTSKHDALILFWFQLLVMLSLTRSATRLTGMYTTSNIVFHRVPKDALINLRGKDFKVKTKHSW